MKNTSHTYLHLLSPQISLQDFLEKIEILSRSLEFTTLIYIESSKVLSTLKNDSDEKLTLEDARVNTHQELSSCIFQIRCLFGKIEKLFEEKAIPLEKEAPWKQHFEPEINKYLRYKEILTRVEKTLKTGKTKGLFGGIL